MNTSALYFCRGIELEQKEMNWENGPVRAPDASNIFFHNTWLLAGVAGRHDQESQDAIFIQPHALAVVTLISCLFLHH